MATGGGYFDDWPRWPQHIQLDSIVQQKTPTMNDPTRQQSWTHKEDENRGRIGISDWLKVRKNQSNLIKTYPIFILIDKLDKIKLNAIKSWERPCNDKNKRKNPTKPTEIQSKPNQNPVKLGKNEEIQQNVQNSSSNPIQTQ